MEKGPCWRTQKKSLLVVCERSVAIYCGSTITIGLTLTFTTRVASAASACIFPFETILSHMSVSLAIRAFERLHLLDFTDVLLYVRFFFYLKDFLLILSAGWVAIVSILLGPVGSLLIHMTEQLRQHKPPWLPLWRVFLGLSLIHI